MNACGQATPQAEAWGIDKRPMPQLSSCGTENHRAAKIRELVP